MLACVLRSLYRPANRLQAIKWPEDIERRARGYYTFFDFSLPSPASLWIPMTHRIFIVLHVPWLLFLFLSLRRHTTVVLYRFCGGCQQHFWPVLDWSWFTVYICLFACLLYTSWLGPPRRTLEWYWSLSRFLSISPSPGIFACNSLFFLCYSLISGTMKLNQAPAPPPPHPPHKTNGPYSHDAWPIATANSHTQDFSREVLHVDSVGYNAAIMLWCYKAQTNGRGQKGFYVFSIILQLKTNLF